MSGTVLEGPAETTTSDVAQSTPVAVLEDRVPPALKLTRRTALCTLLLGLIYGYFSLKPLWHTDVWGHLAYGREIWTLGRLPSSEPLMPLAHGVPFVDTSWLTQVLGYRLMESLGVAGLLGTSALLVASACGLLLHRSLARTRSLACAWLCVGLFLWLDWAPLAVVRPQLLGLACFLIVFHRLTSRRPRGWDWLVLPAVFAVWANVHASFALGWLLIAAQCVGRGVDLVRRTGSLRSLLHDGALRRLFLQLELAIVATLINPYGLELWLETARVARNPNLRSLTEWQPLELRDASGMAFLGSAILLAMLYRFTPRRVAAWEPLTLIVLGVASLWSARFLVWWGPIAAYVLTLHAHAALRRILPWRASAPSSPRNGKWSVVTVGLAWIFVAYSPLGMRLLHHREPALAKVVSDYTPLGAVEYLREHPPQGQVFNVYEWGDFLQWAGPPGLQVFVNSHAHLAPREVWQHYLQVVEQSAGWDEVLERYGVNTVVLDPLYREGLIRRLKDDPRWKLGYEDPRSAVFVRKKPI